MSVLKPGLEARLRGVEEELRRVVEKAGRPAGSVKLLAVGKTFPAEAVAQCLPLGVRAFGENYVQEGAAKVEWFREHYPDVELEWHLIGPLQSNKTRVVAEHFDWVQSVDRLKIAERLNAQRPAGMKPLQVLIEVNIDDSPTKSGLPPAEVEALASQVPDTNGVYFVPALTGLGAPWWDQYARGTITGISRGTTTAHIARAALEGIAYQTMDITNAMSRDAGVPLKELKVDGGASRNNLLMQFQADILGTKVIRPQVVETTAMGAAYLAGLAVGYWSSIDEIRKQWQVDRIFEPSWEEEKVRAAQDGWKDAVKRTLSDYTK